MAEQKKRSALILYYSITGNTEEVAMTFKKVFDKAGWQCDMLKVDKRVDPKKPNVFIDDYDLLIAGSPIMAQLPAKEIYSDKFGILGTQLLKSRRGFAPISQPYGHTKGIVYTTYGGNRVGPPQAIPSLDIMELQMEYMKVKVIGKICIPGGQKWSRRPVDTVARAKGWDVDEAADMLGTYKSDPNAAKFATLTKEDRALFDKALADIKSMPQMRERLEGPGEQFRDFHWETFKRPTDRDLLRAELFMEEIVEDFFGGGIEAQPFCQFISYA